jgi:hypothetical protein
VRFPAGPKSTTERAFGRIVVFLVVVLQVERMGGCYLNIFFVTKNRKNKLS